MELAKGVRIIKVGLYLHFLMMPRYADLTIFELTNTRTKPIALPVVHAHGVTAVYIWHWYILAVSYYTLAQE